MLKKSVTIAGRHNTSISIEKEFDDELRQICKERRMTLNTLITEIDANRKNTDNLSSAVRIYVLEYIKNH